MQERSEGRYVMERGWQDHPLFRGDEFSRRDAWEWLIANACWKETRCRNGKEIITLKRGQLSHSVRFLADKWGWSKSRVERFITQLRNETMIGTDSGTHSVVVITIRNYDEYQLFKATEKEEGGTDIGPLFGTKAGHGRDKEEEGNKKITKPARGANPELAVTIETLSVDHIADWLAKKRGEGEYLEIDENLVLEVFKDYCFSKGKRYDNYVAALRNAFGWDRFKKPAAPLGRLAAHRTKDDRARAAILVGLGRDPGDLGL